MPGAAGATTLPAALGLRGGREPALARTLASAASFRGWRTFFFGLAQPALYSGLALGSRALASASRAAAASPRRETLAFTRYCGRSPVGRFSGSMCSANCSRTTRGPTSSISPTPRVPSASGP